MSDFRVQLRRFIVTLIIGALLFYPPFYVYIWQYSKPNVNQVTFAFALGYLCDYTAKFILSKFWASDDKDTKHIVVQALPYFLAFIINTVMAVYIQLYANLFFIKSFLFWLTPKLNNFTFVDSVVVQVAMILPTSITTIMLFFVWKKMFKH